MGTGNTGRKRVGKGPSAPDKDQKLQIRVNGNMVVIDPNTLTLRERQLVKAELHKLPYDPDDTDTMSATIWVVMQRADEELTFMEVCEGISIADLEEADAVALGGDDTPEG